MRQLLNTLYVTTPDSYLSKDGLNVVVSRDGKELLRIPIHNIESIITFGYIGASPGLMKLCSDNGVSLTFLSPQGRFIGHLNGATRGNVLLRKKQYEIFDNDEICLNLCKIIISAKIQNSRNILRRHLRDYGDNDALISCSKRLEHMKHKALNTTCIEDLRGIEGKAANIYFSVFNELVLTQKDVFIFTERSRRPPRDEINAMLSFVYTLITNDMVSALETVGLDPYLGFMHTIRPGRPSLALDLIEEFRGYLGDRLVLSLINRRQVKRNDFIKQGDTVLMTDDCKKTIISAWQKRKKDTIEHPYLKEKIPVGLLPYSQAMLLARYVRQDLNNYPVFLIL